MRRIYKFLRLGAGDRHLLIQTVLLLSLIRLGLWLLPFRFLWQALPNVVPLQSHLKQPRLTVEQIIGAVEISSCYMPGGVKCLARALVTQILLNHYGYPNQLRIGVAKNRDGKLDAHAWVESQGRVVIGNLKDLSRFTPLPVLKDNSA